METSEYISPTTELIEIEFDQGFALSTTEIDSSIHELRNFGDF